MPGCPYTVLRAELALIAGKMHSLALAPEDASLLSLSASRSSGGWFKLPRWRARTQASMGTPSFDAGGQPSAANASVSNSSMSFAPVDVLALRAAALAAAAAAEGRPARISEADGHGGEGATLVSGSGGDGARSDAMCDSYCNMASCNMATGPALALQGSGEGAAPGSWPMAGGQGGSHAPGISCGSSLTTSQQDLARRLAAFAAAARLVGHSQSVAKAAEGQPCFHPTVAGDSICNLGDVQLDRGPHHAPVDPALTSSDDRPDAARGNSGGGSSLTAAPQPVTMSHSRLPSTSSMRPGGGPAGATTRRVKGAATQIMTEGVRSDCSSPRDGACTGGVAPASSGAIAADPTRRVSPGASLMDARGMSAAPVGFEVGQQPQSSPAAPQPGYTRSCG